MKELPAASNVRAATALLVVVDVLQCHWLIYDWPAVGVRNFATDHCAAYEREIDVVDCVVASDHHRIGCGG
jgi:hypothetical protein